MRMAPSRSATNTRPSGANDDCVGAAQLIRKRVESSSSAPSEVVNERESGRPRRRRGDGSSSGDAGYGHSQRRKSRALSMTVPLSTTDRGPALSNGCPAPSASTTGDVHAKGALATVAARAGKLSASAVNIGREPKPRQLGRISRPPDPNPAARCPKKFARSPPEEWGVGWWRRVSRHTTPRQAANIQANSSLPRRPFHSPPR